jgi:Kef-type K+ transport system membrane component KefB
MQNQRWAIHKNETKNQRMKRKSKPVFYLLTIGGTGFIIALVLKAGKQLERTHHPDLEFGYPIQNRDLSPNHPLGIFILQISLILFLARLFSVLFRRIGQPGVVGEIFAGIFLGPSVIGALFPQFTHYLFPPVSLGNLEMFSQLGLVLFMFVVGLELDLTIIKRNLGPALVISHTGIIVPFALGTTVSYFFYETLAPPNIPFYGFALFMGIAMSITAFPVLSRIIRERGLSQTRLGTMAITCAAMGDISAWCLLALVLAIIRSGKLVNSFYFLITVPLYGLVMVYLLRPLLRKILQKGKTDSKGSALAVVFLVLLLSAYCTEMMGIHALFGAFFAGLIMPADPDFRNQIIHKIEGVALVLLLPLFFVITGLRTRVGLLDHFNLWMVFLAILGIALAGKFVATTLAARFTGESLKDSLSLGALMNTRGLVELVVLNIGYELGILTPYAFTIMVLMALLTTCLTSPALYIIQRLFVKKEIRPASQDGLRKSVLP